MTQTAIRLAQSCNDYLADKIAEKPDRYGGFAHLALQDPGKAANELERCVRDLCFSGAMINSTTNGAYLDDDRFSVLWERSADLDVPIYIHPNNPADIPYMFHNHSELWGPLWSWTVETGTHALRILFSGVFDRFPNAKLILGHMGETLPYQLWRLDSRWEISNQGARQLEHPPSVYFKKNFWCTTSGVCSDAPLRCAIDALAEDRVLFAVDYPFERPEEAGNWIESAALTEIERKKICCENARTLLNF